jgi:hypothetical protein
VDETEALAALRQILARPEFQTPPPPIWERWWRRAQEWLIDQIMDFLQRLSPDTLARLDWVQLIVLLLACIVILAVLAFVARGIGLAVGQESRLRATRQGRSRERSDQLWRQGHALAAEGRLAESARALYLSALYALAERGLLRVDEAQTNREHAVRAVRVEARLGRLFERLVSEYDRLRYGQYDVDRRTIGELSELVGQMRDAHVS